MKNSPVHRRYAFLFSLLLVLFLSPRLAADANSTATGNSRPGELRTPDWHQVTGVASPPALAARAAVLVEAETGTVLYSLNPHLVLPPASLTKVVAIHAAVVAARLGEFDLDATFEPPPESWAINQPPGSSLMFLGANQVLTNRQLLSGLAISSGNDAAVALALQVDGSIPEFARRMNAIVRDAGLVVTAFVEPSGLSPLNVTTAYEYAAFLRMHIREFPELLALLYSRSSFTYPQEENRTAGDGWPPISQNNRNTLLATYAGTDGIKTGYIDESGYHLAATASRDGRRLIAVVLGVEAASHQAGDELRAVDAAALLDYGFDNFEVVRIGHPPLDPVRVFRGKRATVEPVVAQSLSVSVPIGAAARLRGSAVQVTEVVAPVPEGSRIGSVNVMLDGVEIGESVITMPDVPKGGFFRRLWDGLLLFFRSISGKDRPVEAGRITTVYEMPVSALMYWSRS